MNNYCLKVGNKYSIEHVHALAKQIPDLICITDNPSGLETNWIPLPVSELKTWWHKMALFNSDWFDGGIFFDLDIEIKKSIENVFQSNGDVTLLRTDWEDLDQLNIDTIGDRYKYCSINSTVLAWNTNAHQIWEDFYSNHKKIMSLFSGIDTYLEHRHYDKLSFFDSGLVGSYRCDPKADVHIMSYDGEGKSHFFNRFNF